MNATTIVPYKLAIGSFTALEGMHSEGWECMCLATNVSPPSFCKHIPLVDGGGSPPVSIRDAIQWIVDNWRIGNKTYVCCRHGMNRSVLVSTAAMTLVYGGWFIENWRKISDKRSVASGRDDTLADVLRVLETMRSK
jgi:hypothetical protein